MKSKLIAVTFTVMLLAALVGGATMAWFTDEAESAPDNIITAGDLAIDVNRVLDNPAPEPAYIFDNIQPGDRAGNWGTTPGMAELVWDITNEGSVDGNLSFEIDNLDGKLNMKIRPQYWVDGQWKGESGSIIEGYRLENLPL